MSTISYRLEQPVHNGAVWEPVENSDCATLADARATMATLEADLGWRDMRIVEVTTDGNMQTRTGIVEYGTESAE